MVSITISEHATASEPIIGWKQWGIYYNTTSTDALRLTPLIATKSLAWEPGRIYSAHDSAYNSLWEPNVWWPHGLNPGIYAVKNYSCSNVYKRDLKVVGQVALWGDVIEHEHGYRGEFAYPQHLWVWQNEIDTSHYTETIIRTLRRIYGIEVTEGKPECSEFECAHCKNFNGNACLLCG